MFKILLKVFICFFCFNVHTIYANDYFHTINVNIYAHHTVKFFSFRVVSGSYKILSQNKTLAILNASESCDISIKSNKISLRFKEEVFDNLSLIKFVALVDSSYFNIKGGNIPTRSYDDNLTVSIVGNGLKLINNVDIEKYVAAVVQAEGGIMQNEEFFKVQAVACRTYVLRNIKRHHKEGFQMCDREHCQVYHGKCSKPEIEKMTQATKSFVIVDKDLNFITSAFHANCGGQTINSEHVWSLPASYMKSVSDTFCIHGRHAFWEVKIKKDVFLNYLVKNYNFPINDSVLVNQALNFSQTDGRKVYFFDKPAIHLKHIRADFNLKSTFFSIILQDDDTLIFRGKGFGHGVGLCQEGAMHMINAGYKYDEIIKHYFTDVYIISFDDIQESF